MGVYHKVIEGKIYRTAIKRDSVHHELWSKSLKVLMTTHFVGVNEKYIPTLKNWMTTIKGWYIVHIVQMYKKNIYINNVRATNLTFLSLVYWIMYLKM